MTGCVWVIAGFVTLLGCADPIGSDVLPPGVRDPAEIQTPEGPVAAYHSVHLRFRDAFHLFVLDGGLLTDELGTNLYGQPIMGQPATLDRRYLPESGYNDAGSFSPYALAHRVRAQASEAVGLLANYGPPNASALRAHAYLLAGFAEVLLADVYCSGIPLSTIDFGGDFTLRPGSTTDQVYRHALALFDSALTLGGDSARVVNLARLGRGRALLALGQYAEAGQAVNGVPDGFSYAIGYNDEGGTRNFVGEYFDGASAQGNQVGATMTDREGGNGLDYISSSDPRVSAVRVGENKYGFEIHRPDKYSTDGTSPITLADWIEARLIQAEVAMQAADARWLEILNTLRTDDTFSTAPNEADSTRTDTLWNAGTAGAAGLAPLVDPGTPDGRVDLLFRERAFWLFLTAHRQGDLRRLVRHYRRDPEDVYPSGLYPDGWGGYGQDVTVPVPEAEREFNPHYTGCAGRGA